jgi:hypothetical protein
MTAAVLQGAPVTTLDADLWIDLPPREYHRLLAICARLGGKALARTVVALRDETLVNFLYRVDGVGSFERELKRARRVRWAGTLVPAMALASVLRSKASVGRPKDLAHLPLLRQTLRASRG